jgi:ATP-dependent helicase HrpA
VVDAEGNPVDAGDDLEAIRAVRHRRPARHSPRRHRWGAATSCGGISARSSEVVEQRGSGHVVRAYLTLLDRGDSVSLKVVDNEALQQRAMRGGVRRLLLMAAARPQRRSSGVLDAR